MILTVLTSPQRYCYTSRKPLPDPYKIYNVVLDIFEGPPVAYETKLLLLSLPGRNGPRVTKVGRSSNLSKESSKLFLEIKLKFFMFCINSIIVLSLTLSVWLEIRISQKAVVHCSVARVKILFRRAYHYDRPFNTCVCQEIASISWFNTFKVTKSWRSGVWWGWAIICVKETDNIFEPKVKSISVIQF